MSALQALVLKTKERDVPNTLEILQELLGDYRPSARWRAVMYNLKHRNLVAAKRIAKSLR